ncbi:MAG TPA: hypothetical protein P5562_02680 [Candidatus Woesebacteria bacterium]|nr:hypothetical protein [Candidatus Woesebacteria bacterium]
MKEKISRCGQCSKFTPWLSFDHPSQYQEDKETFLRLLRNPAVPAEVKIRVVLESCGNCQTKPVYGEAECDSYLAPTGANRPCIKKSVL